MQLTVDYQKSANDKQNESDMQTTANLVSYAIQNVYKEGLDGNGGLRRTYGRIQRKLDQAIEQGTKTMDLETAEIEMIKKAVQEVKFPAAWSKFVMFLEDAIQEAMSKPAVPQEPAAPAQPEPAPQA